MLYQLSYRRAGVSLGPRVLGPRWATRLAPAANWASSARVSLIGWTGRRIAKRSRWLADRLWFIAAVEVAWLANRHWHRLDRDERRRLRELIWKSRGRPSNLSAREREEADELLEKLGYAELGGDITGTLLPFRPLARLVEFALGRAQVQERRRPQRRRARRG